ncbi:TAFII28-domain-containing protein [Coniophora puteana RWD-64-598 SS2]|uniref:Transcription initiation factor TFIID subunit 11 n=1 Tax=Coniophora puteana (strain RWD-64-598) TaxID=741705 RepID=A0A5M3MFZ1_CONPW|nr:TAFII28-domain-containing protein [Coniophora puteana RWD-64-598 SS2]EIW77916.1 TAFII28-domain-containing protein [Coniophora puteana RWD-64-598 SS2]
MPATTGSSSKAGSVQPGATSDDPSRSIVASPTEMETGEQRQGSTAPQPMGAGARGSQQPGATGGTPAPGARPDEDAEGEDEILPAMADDDYSAQLSWQSQSKDNLKVLMDNFSPAQYDRFEAYRRHALPKQAVRKVIQQTTGQQVSQPVAQIVAGFGKVFVGEIVEKAREVQTRRNETGPLTPDHLREAYRMYQEETGRVGSARAGRGRRLFVR